MVSHRYGWLSDYSANLGSILQAKLATFSANLKIQDGAECVNILILLLFKKNYNFNIGRMFIFYMISSKFGCKLFLCEEKIMSKLKNYFFKPLLLAPPSWDNMVKGILS